MVKYSILLTAILMLNISAKPINEQLPKQLNKVLQTDISKEWPYLRGLAISGLTGTAFGLARNATINFFNLSRDTSYLTHWAFAFAEVATEIGIMNNMIKDKNCNLAYTKNMAAGWFTGLMLALAFTGLMSDFKFDQK